MTEYKHFLASEKDQFVAGDGIFSDSLQVCQNAVIPAQAGIQTKDFNLVSLDSRLRRG